jgi:Cu+-exporting ATPase
MVPALHFSGQQYVALALTLPIVLWVAWPFHAATVKNLRLGTATMDTLITLGSLSALGYSAWLIFAGEHHNFLEVAAVVPVAVLFGKWLELKTRRSATDAVRALLAGLPEQVWVLEGNGQRRQVALDSVQPGQEILVAAGERVPVDGELLSHDASFDLAHLTGEALPVELTAGEVIAAGAVNRSGEVTIRALRQASESRVARIAQLVREATAQKTHLRSLVDRISAIFVPAVVLFAITTLAFWTLIVGNTESGVAAALAVLVVACPCALGIAIPMSMAVATGIGSKRGVVIRQPDALSQLRKVKTAIFDKTGTLTKGELKVVRVELVDQTSKGALLALAGAIAAKSRHPVSKAIFEYCAGLGEVAELDAAAKTTELPGVGVRVESNGRVFELVRPSRVQVELVQSRVNATSESMPHVTVFLENGKEKAYFLVEDELRADAKTAIRELESLGIAPVLLSGDIDARVASLAKELEIGSWFSGATPEDKIAILRELQAQAPVAMVGDGLNDIAVLAAADVGIAMGSGSHAAQSAAEITILDDSPRSVPFAIRLGRATWNNLRQNLGCAFGYNLVLIPLAAMGLLQPMFAGIAMAFSSVSVVLNAKRMGWGFSSKRWQFSNRR